MSAEPSTPTPNGDESRRGLWITLGGVALVAAVALIWAVRGSELARYWRFDTRATSSTRVADWPPKQSAATGSGDRPSGVMVVLRDGRTLVSVDRAGRVQGLYDRSPETMKLVSSVLLEGVLPTPASPDLVVRDVRPTFRWRPQPSPTSYRVTIADERGATVASSPAIGGTSWQSTTPLQPGHAYAWQVTPQGGAASPAVRFRIIDPESARVLDARLARAGQSNLAKGLALLQAGVLDEAEQAFAGLAADNEGSERVLKLLDQVRARRTAAAGRN